MNLQERVCGSCGVAFVPWRRDQRGCSRRCGKAICDRRYREREGDSIRARRRARHAANAAKDNERARCYRVANPGRIRAGSEAWRLANPDRVRRAQRRWYEKNRERVIAAANARQKADPEWARERNERWRKRNPRAVKVMRNRNRRARAGKGAAVARTRILERDGWICGLCGGAIDPTLSFPHPLSAEVDHVTPIAVGGKTTPENLQAAHRSCNAAKGARS